MMSLLINDVVDPYNPLCWSLKEILAHLSLLPLTLELAIWILHPKTPPCLLSAD